MVKIPGKDFTTLNFIEAASMIENHLSLYCGPEGIHGESFDKDALYEFIDYPNPNPNADLERVRKRLQEIDETYRTREVPDGFAFEGGQAEARALVERLRRGEV